MAASNNGRALSDFRPADNIFFSHSIDPQRTIYTPISGCTVTVFINFSHYFLIAAAYCLLPTASRAQRENLEQYHPLVLIP